MTILVNVAGGDALIAWFQSRPGALDAQLGIAFAGIADALYQRVLKNLAGDVVKDDSGKLRDALTQASDTRSATIGVDSGAVPYGARWNSARRSRAQSDRQSRTRRRSPSPSAGARSSPSE